MKIYFDGACEPMNPGGNMGWGVHIHFNNKKFYNDSGFQAAAPQNSNNLAEYLAFKLALDLIVYHAHYIKIGSITIMGDSQLVVKQMNGEWEIKKGRYVNMAWTCKKLLEKLRADFRSEFPIDVVWIPRERNTKADELSKQQFKNRNIQITAYAKYGKT